MEITAQSLHRRNAGTADRHAVWPVFVFVAVLALNVALVLALNGGQFSYALDDPYIHLALAEHLAQFQYGINPGEHAAPSSSILWPVLLVPLAGTPLHEWVPFFWNALCGVAVVMLLQRAVERIFERGWPAVARWSGGIALVLALGLNIPGLVFTGMEHTMQVLLALAVAYGLILEVEERRLAWWFIAAILLGPLVRYENLVLSLAALLWVAMRGRPGVAFLAGSLVAAALAGFSIFLRSLGLSWLPSSILVKKGLVPGEDIGWIATAVRWLWNSVPHYYWGWILLLFLAVAVWGAIDRKARPVERGLAVVALFAVLAHVLNGQDWSFPRYEMYVMAASGLLLLYCRRRRIVEWARRRPGLHAFAAAGLVFAVLFWANVAATLQSPLASNNIYDQQFQMHRAALEITDAPVAVNDLGWVAFRNDRYVLDLWGLGSNEAARLRRLEVPDWMGTIAAARGVDLAMIYDEWLGRHVPADWIRLGALLLERPRITPGSAAVVFYATSPEAAERLRAKLGAFAASLPDGARFDSAGSAGG